MTRGLIDSSSAASFCTQFDIFNASTSACRSISSSGMPVGGIFTAAACSRDRAEPQGGRGDAAPFRQQHRAFDRVLELANVPGPVVAHQQLGGVGLEAVDLLLQLAREAADERRR